MTGILSAIGGAISGVFGLATDLIGAVFGFLMPMPDMDTPDLDNTERTYGIRSTNKSAYGARLGIVYGRMKVDGLRYYETYMNPVNNNTRYGAAFVLSEGEIDAIEQLFIGDRPVEEYPGTVDWAAWYGSDTQVATAADDTGGDSDGKSIVIDPAHIVNLDYTIPEAGSDEGGTGSSGQPIENDPIFRVVDPSNPGGTPAWTPGDARVEIVTPESLPTSRLDYTTATECERLILGIYAPAGIRKFENGQIKDHTVKFTVYYRKLGETNYVHAGSWQITAASGSPIRAQFDIFKHLPKATYELAICDLNDVLPELATDSSETAYIDEIRLGYVLEGIYGTYNMRGSATVEIEYTGSEQLKKAETVHALIRGKIVRIYTDSVTYTEAWSQNPAWVIADYLTGRSGLGVSWANVDIDSFITAAGKMTTAGVTLNGRTNPDKDPKEIIAEMEKAGMCTLVEDGPSFRLIYNEPITATPESYGLADMCDTPEEDGFSWQEIADSERMNRIVVKYLDEDGSYKENAVAMSDQDNIESIGEIREKVYQIPWCTGRSQAYMIAARLRNYFKHARYIGVMKTGSHGLRHVIGDEILLTYDPAGFSDLPVLIRKIEIDGDGWCVLTWVNYSDSYYDEADVPTDPTTPAVTKEKADLVTGLTATQSERIDDDDRRRKQVTLAWTNPTDTKFDRAVIMMDDGQRGGFAVVQETGGETSLPFDVTGGRTYTFCVCSLSTDGLITSIPDSPQVAVIVDFETPPDLVFDATSCRWDGMIVYAAIVAIPNFGGEYEIRTSDPADWSTDQTGFIGRSGATMQAYSASGSDPITIYGRARSSEGIYSENTTTISIAKAEDSPIPSDDYQQSYSRNLLRNAAFLNVASDPDSGAVRFNFWDGNGGELEEITDETQWGYGPYCLKKPLDGLTFSQTVNIARVTTSAGAPYTLSYWAAGASASPVLDAPIIYVEYLDSDMVLISGSGETCAGTAGGTDWQLNKFNLTAPQGADFMRIWMKGKAYYDAVMLAYGLVFPPFELNNADQVDGIDTELEQQAAAQFLTRIEGDISDLRSQIDNITDFWEALNMDSSVMRTQAFRINARAIEIVAGDIDGNSSRITLVENRVVIVVNASGYLASFTLGTGAYGSVVTIKADQINIDGTTTFYNTKTMAENINLGSTTINGGMITANTIVARVGLVGALLEIDSGSSTVYRPASGGFSGEYVAAGVYIGCSAHSSDTTATRLRVDLDGNLWIGAVAFASAPFHVTNAGVLNCEDGIAKNSFSVNDGWTASIRKTLIESAVIKIYDVRTSSYTRGARISGYQYEKRTLGGATASLVTGQDIQIQEVYAKVKMYIDGASGGTTDTAHFYCGDNSGYVTIEGGYTRGKYKSSDGTAAVSGTFVDNSGNTITVKDGIITALS